MFLRARDLFAAYPNHPDIQPSHEANALELSRRVNALLNEFVEDGNEPLTASPVTGTLCTLRNAGWRPPNASGAPGSAHKQGAAVDLHDPDARLDNWILSRPDVLVRYNLYMEDPSATEGQVTKGGWCHLTIRAPRSGRRVFMP